MPKWIVNGKSLSPFYVVQHTNPLSEAYLRNTGQTPQQNNVLFLEWLIERGKQWMQDNNVTDPTNEDLDNLIKYISGL